MATKDISGRHGLGLFGPADRQSSSGSKSPLRTDEDGYAVRERTCKKCKTVKPYSEFYVNSKGNRRWSCKDCEKKEERTRKHLHPEESSVSFKSWSKKKRGFALVNQAKYRASQRNLPFSLNAKDIQRRIDIGTCELTGILFNLDGGKTWDSPSLDRIIPAKGYIHENVRVVLYCVNVMANIWGANKIMEIAQAISQQRKNQSEYLQNSLVAALKKRLPMENPLFNLTWKELVTPSGRRIYALRASKRRISDSDYGSWPTPQAGTPATETYNEAGNTDNGRKTVALVSGWPTPDTGIGPHGYRGVSTNPKSQSSRDIQAIARLTSWATPTATERSGQGPKNSSLFQDAKLASWATPRVGNNGGYGNPNRANDGKVRLEDQVHGVTASGSSAETEKPGQLNPAFSLWLMGFPPEWESCAPRATPSSHRSRRK